MQQHKTNQNWQNSFGHRMWSVWSEQHDTRCSLQLLSQSSCFFLSSPQDQNSAEQQDVSVRLWCSAAISTHWATLSLTLLLFISVCYHLQSAQTVQDDWQADVLHLQQLLLSLIHHHLPAAASCCTGWTPVTGDISPALCLQEVIVQVPAEFSIHVKVQHLATDPDVLLF